MSSPKVSSLSSPSPKPIPVYTTVEPLRTLRHQTILSGQTIGYIPTMGALHTGHLSLIIHATPHHRVLVVSIFINPAQFAPNEDLSRYPRTLESDLKDLHSLNAQLDLQDPTGTELGRVTAVFCPDAAVMYPKGIPLDQALQEGTFVSVDPLGRKLEGVTRPHFIRGVATVCTKLFNIVQPDAAYIGQKDIQQAVALKSLVQDLHFPIKLVVCPTMRDPIDGIALSSRNLLLGETRRGYSACLYQALQAGRRVYEEGLHKGGAEVREILSAAAMVMRKFVDDGKVELEYISLAEGDQLEEFRPEEKVGRERGEGAVLSGAVRILPQEEGQGMVRLIDNFIL